MARRFSEENLTFGPVVSAHLYALFAAAALAEEDKLYSEAKYFYERISEEMDDPYVRAKLCSVQHKLDSKEVKETRSYP